MLFSLVGHLSCHIEASLLEDLLVSDFVELFGDLLLVLLSLLFAIDDTSRVAF